MGDPDVLIPGAARARIIVRRGAGARHVLVGFVRDMRRPHERTWIRLTVARAREFAGALVASVRADHLVAVEIEADDDAPPQPSTSPRTRDDRFAPGEPWRRGLLTAPAPAPTCRKRHRE